MSRNKKKNKIKIFTKYYLLLCLCLFILICFGLAREWIRAHNINREIRAMKNEIKRLEKTNKAFSEQIEYYKTLAFLEKEARRKMGMTKEGEKVVIVNNNKEKNSVDNTKKNHQNTVLDKSNVVRWFYYFFNSDKIN
jgi:cell division protein FtsB